MDAEVPRFDLLNRMSGVTWAGCVEIRPGDLGVTDAEPDIATPDSLFVPSFAPDEPDSTNADGDRYNNSYLADDGGTCIPQESTCVRRDWRGHCVQYRTASLDPDVAQKQLCKYDNVSVVEGLSGTTITGPNHMCDSTPITPLSSDRQTIDDAIDALTAQGYTNIIEGVMWGWRVLSQQEPFTEALPANTPNNLKILVLMSDGANTLTSMGNHNLSNYSAWGFGATRRLDPSAHTSSAFTAAMDAKTDAACQNARNDGIIIYSVAYNLGSQAAARALLRRCASDPQNFFEPGSEADLVKAFEAIGTDLNQLRHLELTRGAAA